MKKIYAKDTQNCIATEEELNTFLKTHHKQGSVTGQLYNCSLKYNDQLVAVMTFGYPRYNPNAEFELLRLCFHSEYTIVGGSEKMFNAFLNSKKVRSIISYCDTTYFSGAVYERLGFKLLNKGSDQIIWHKDDKEIYNTQLLKYGPDKLIGTNYGKGTNNEKIMIAEGWTKEIRAPQSVYILSAECDGKIYGIRDLSKNKIVYVGQTKNTLEHRFKGHCSTKSKSAINEAILKYGVGNFQIELIDTANNYFELNKKERYHIKKYQTIVGLGGYNILPGGYGLRIFRTDDEIKKILSENSKKNWENSDYRENLSKMSSDRLTKKWADKKWHDDMVDKMKEYRQDENYKQHMADKANERYADPEYRLRHKASQNTEAVRRKKSENTKKAYENAKTVEKLSNSVKKNWQNEEFREKQRIARIKSAADPEVKRKRSEGIKAAWAKRKAMQQAQQQQ